MDITLDALLLRPEDAFRRLGVSRSHGYALLQRGELPSIKIGRCRRIPVAALAAWIRDRTVESGAC